MRSYYFVILFLAFGFQVMGQNPIRSVEAEMKVAVPGSARDIIDLSGTWEFATDELNAGIRERWFAKRLHDSILLPGTMDLNRKGKINRDTTTLHLNRLYTYEGPAWYRKTIYIPESWRKRHVSLVLERTKHSMVWIDGIHIGESLLLQSPQEFHYAGILSPGNHTVTIRVNNDLGLTPYGNVHIYSDDTQTNWNGITGRMFIQAMDPTFIDDVQVYPDVDAKKLRVVVKVKNAGRGKVDVQLSLRQRLYEMDRVVSSQLFRLNADSLLEINYSMPPATELWDEHNPALYSAEITLQSGTVKDSRTVSFGMRRFAVMGTRFSINGTPVFLRGKHDACVFPLQGHSPMTVDEWVKVFNIAKAYGINHYRFHSWCPPEAAFEAADLTGMYLQAELPFWGGLDSDKVAQQLLQEGEAMLKAYGNHPSFVLFAAGNEIWSGHDRVKKLMARLKALDSRHLYAQGSNNSIGYAGFMEGTDFHVAARTPSSGDTTLTHTRLTHAFADTRKGGILNTRQPSAMVDFRYAVAAIKAPLITHEIGQYQIFPDYDQVKKYTGVLKPWNLEIFRSRLQRSGMYNQNAAFARASGALAAICYRAEIEAALRTPGLAGFQLLDLQDFPGQGTALVGILDAFMDSKNIIKPEEWRRFCNDVVALLKFEKYCWSDGETFHAEAMLANYSAQAIATELPWRLMDERGSVIQGGRCAPAAVGRGEVRNIGEFDIPLVNRTSGAAKLTVVIGEDGSDYQNSYDIWVYPVLEITPGKIAVENQLNQRVVDRLLKGEKVLLFPQQKDIAGNSVEGMFPPDFWNYGMFRKISESNKKEVSPGTLGLLIDSKHPSLAGFTTAEHSDWQWWRIVKHSSSLNLNATGQDYVPIIQVIDNFERNNKYGMLFEFNVGAGKLLVCTARLPEIKEHPEVKQLYRSLIDYMQSDKFQPKTSADTKVLRILGLLH